MIQSYLTTPTLLASNEAPLAFQRDCIKPRNINCCNGWLCHNEGSPIYKVTKGGRYHVTFNANISSDTTGQVAFALFMDGVEVPGTRVMTQVTTAGIYSNVAFDKVISNCCCGSTTLTIQSVPSVLSGTGATPTATNVPTIQNANITITRIA